MSNSKVCQSPLKFIGLGQDENGKRTEKIRYYECPNAVGEDMLMYFIQREKQKYLGVIGMLIVFKVDVKSHDYVDLLFRQHKDAIVTSATMLRYSDLVEGIRVRHDIKSRTATPEEMEASMNKAQQSDEANEETDGEEPKDGGDSGDKAKTPHDDEETIEPVTVGQIFGQESEKPFNHDEPFGRSNVMEDGKLYGENFDESQYTFIREKKNPDGTTTESILGPEHEWFDKLRNYLDLLRERYKGEHIHGVTNAMLYLGAVFTGSSEHLEDFFLGSINYLFKGSAVKYWLIIEAKYLTKLMELYKDEIGKLGEKYGCPMYILHKVIILDTELLKKHNIPYYIIKQVPHSMVVTFAEAAHQVVNSGNNLAIAKNWAYPEWFFEARSIPRCICAVNNNGWKWLWNLLYKPETQMRSAVALKQFPEEIYVMLKEYNERKDNESVCFENMTFKEVDGIEVIEIIEEQPPLAITNPSSFDSGASASVVNPSKKSTHVSSTLRKRKLATESDIEPKLPRRTCNTVVEKDNTITFGLGSRKFRVRPTPNVVIKQMQKDNLRRQQKTQCERKRRENQRIAAGVPGAAKKNFSKSAKKLVVAEEPKSAKLKLVKRDLSNRGFVYEVVPPNLGNDVGAGNKVKPMEQNGGSLSASGDDDRTTDENESSGDESGPSQHESGPSQSESEHSQHEQNPSQNESGHSQNESGPSENESGPSQDEQNSSQQFSSNSVIVQDVQSGQPEISLSSGQEGEKVQGEEKNHGQDGNINADTSPSDLAVFQPSDSKQCEQIMRTLATARARNQRTVVTNLEKRMNPNNSGNDTEILDNRIVHARELIVEYDEKHLLLKCLLHVFKKDAVKFQITENFYSCKAILKHYISPKEPVRFKKFWIEVENEIKRRNDLNKPFDREVLQRIDGWREVMEIGELERLPILDVPKFILSKDAVVND